MKITFNDTNAAITHKINGDINISPKFIKIFGIIEGTYMQPSGFVFDGKGEAVGIKIESEE